MGYDPNEPRDMSGKWSDGGPAKGSKGNRSLVDRISTQHQRETAGAVLKGAATGLAEGIVAGAVIGAVTGGFGVGAAPALIARGVVSGAIAGAKLHPAIAALNVGLGVVSGLQKQSSLAVHQANVKLHIKKQHIDAAKQRAKKEGF